jgi:light-regulated signal transduction histidine kinase (bacteriophytochrome)
VIRWFQTLTQPKLKKRKKISRVSTGARSSRRTYKGFVERNKVSSQKNQELHKTNELDRFVYSTSHDLRAPLKSMLGLIANKESEEPRNTDQIVRLEMLNKV